VAATSLPRLRSGARRARGHGRTQLHPRLDRPAKASSSPATAFSARSATLTRQTAKQAHFPSISGTTQRIAGAKLAKTRRYASNRICTRLSGAILAQ
jgi:hypothetical protein